MQPDPRTDWRTPHFWFDRLLLVVLIALLRAADLIVLLIRPRLLLTYLRLRLAEVWASPYAVEPTEPAMIYGETPVVIALWMFWRAGLRRGDHLLDLGAGRGIPLLAARFLGAAARGVENIEQHVAAVRGALRFASVELEVGDAEACSWADATHLYLAWTCFAPGTRRQITERLSELAAGTRVITVDHALEHARARLVESKRLPFPWGWTRVWFYELSAP